ncbi:imm11 family protein [Caulobacter sp. DWP3-1-3b2]|uniref:imm11 family protein n=1 Tax=Caulobacter sp. DWP3-1-3b2 TaxID=2804643 RepID=UPI003CEA87E5
MKSLLPLKRYSQMDHANMSKLTVPEMLAQAVPGGESIFPATSKAMPKPPRFLEISRNFDRDSSRKATSLERISTPDDQAPSFGGINGSRVSLSEASEMRVEFVGNSSNALDYYDCSGSIFFASEKLKRSIENVDTGAMEFRELNIMNNDHLHNKYYLAMPFREIFGVDTEFTDVVVRSHELIPGRYLNVQFYGERLVLRSDIPSSVHVFKDLASPWQFWSVDLVRHIRNNEVKGLSARDPSRLTSEYDVKL